MQQELFEPRHNRVLAIRCNSKHERTAAVLGGGLRAGGGKGYWSRNYPEPEVPDGVAAYGFSADRAWRKADEAPYAEDVLGGAAAEPLFFTNKTEVAERFATSVYRTPDGRMVRNRRDVAIVYSINMDELNPAEYIQGGGGEFVPPGVTPACANWPRGGAAPGNSEYIMSQGFNGMHARVSLGAPGACFASDATLVLSSRSDGTAPQASPTRFHRTRRSCRCIRAATTW